jgi:mannose/fructose/N-acetylgalactosamine-specific phosphotransferase system component IID
MRSFVSQEILTMNSGQMAVNHRHRNGIDCAHTNNKVQLCFTDVANNLLPKYFVKMLNFLVEILRSCLWSIYDIFASSIVHKVIHIL